MSRSMTLTLYRLTRALNSFSRSNSMRYPPFPEEVFSQCRRHSPRISHPALLHINRHQHLTREILEGAALFRRRLQKLNRPSPLPNPPESQKCILVPSRT